MRPPKPTYSTGTVVGKTSVPVTAGYERKIRGIWNEIKHKGIRRKTSNQGYYNRTTVVKELSRADIEALLEKINPSVHTNDDAPPYTAEYYNRFVADQLVRKFRRKSHKEIDNVSKRLRKKNQKKFHKRKKFHNKKSLKNEGTIKNVDGRTYRISSRKSNHGPNKEGPKSKNQSKDN